MTVPKPSQNLVKTKSTGKLEARADEIIAMVLNGRPQREIAAKYGSSLRGLQLFLLRHKEDVVGTKNRLVEQVKEVWIADAARRIAGMDEDWRALAAVQDARAADPEFANIPGYSTGRMVRTIKSVGSGENAQLVDEFKVDVGVIAERRNLVMAAAELLGEVTSRPKGDTHIQNNIVLVREYHVHGGNDSVALG